MGDRLGIPRAARFFPSGQENSFRLFLPNIRAGLVSFLNRAPRLWNYFIC